MSGSALEVWMPVPDYPYYQASSFGRIRTLPRWVMTQTASPKLRKGVILSANAGTSGRLKVVVYNSGEKESRSVHSLVCAAFHGPRPTERPLACHRDGDYLNNRPENLYWGTYSENAQDSVRHGTHRESSKTHCTRGHEKTEENMYVRPDGRGRMCRTCSRLRASRRKRAAGERGARLGRILAGAYEVEP